MQRVAKRIIRPALEAVDPTGVESPAAAEGKEDEEDEDTMLEESTARMMLPRLRVRIMGKEIADRRSEEEPKQEKRFTIGIP